MALLDFVQEYLGESAPETLNQEGKTNLDSNESTRVIIHGWFQQQKFHLNSCSDVQTFHGKLSGKHPNSSF